VKQSKQPVFSGPSGRKKQHDHPTHYLCPDDVPTLKAFEEAFMDSPGFVAQPPAGSKDVVFGRDKFKTVHEARSKRPVVLTQTDRNGVTKEILAEDVQAISDVLRDRGIVLERPQGSSLHHFLDWIKDSPAWHEWVRWMDWTDEVKGLLDLYQSFVVEHDWAAVLKGKMDEGDFPLPFDGTCFEFRISSLRVLFLVSVGPGGNMSSDVECKMVVGVNGRWHINADRFYFQDGRLFSRTLKRAVEDEVPEQWGWADEFLSLVGRQVKAICVMLDAEVATVQTIRVSEKLNSIRERKGKAPMKDYHVVSLARRHHASPMPEGHVVTPGTRKRLHFRRGHWRHYQDHRTWINWMLVGDESLGFVDKEYRL
jgi:hypothetical protein